MKHAYHRPRALWRVFALLQAGILIVALVALSAPATFAQSSPETTTETSTETTVEDTGTPPENPEQKEKKNDSENPIEEAATFVADVLAQALQIEVEKSITVTKAFEGTTTASCADFSFTVAKSNDDEVGTFAFDADCSVTVPITDNGSYVVFEVDEDTVGFNVSYTDNVDPNNKPGCHLSISNGNTEQSCTITNTVDDDDGGGQEEGSPPVANDMALMTTKNTALNFVLDWSDPDSDPATDFHFTDPAHGDLTGSAPNLTYTPDADYVGDDMFTFSVDAGGDTSNTATVTIEVIENQTGSTTVVLTKIVCEDEADLPNWGADGAAEALITVDENTAPDFLAQHPNCHVEPGWEFEWGTQNAYYDLPDNALGHSDPPTTGYNVLTPTNASGTVTLVVDLASTTQIRLREVMQPDFLHFTHEDTNDNSNNVSPEFYCYNDVRNYDSIEYIENPEDGETYHCVAWNVGDDDGTGGEEDVCTFVSDTDTEEDGGPATVLTFIHSAWTSIVDALWIWSDDGPTNPEVDQTRTFTRTFTLSEAPTTAHLELAADNGYILRVNGVEIDNKIAVETNYGTTTHYEIAGDLSVGSNTLEIEVKNFGIPGSTAESNPAGLIYKLVIDGDECGGIGGGEGNDAPVAHNQAATTTIDTPVNITLTATDPDGDSLDWFITGDPALGVLTGTAPFLTYTPNASTTGNDTFFFKVNDGSLDSNIATVTVAITATSTGGGGGGDEGPPVANDMTATTTVNTPVGLTLSWSDPDGDPATDFHFTDPVNGTVSGVAPDITYTPNTDFLGVDTFTFRVDAGGDTSNTATVTVNVIASTTGEVLSATSDGGGGGGGGGGSRRSRSNNNDDDNFGIGGADPGVLGAQEQGDILGLLAQADVYPLGAPATGAGGMGMLATGASLILGLLGGAGALLRRRWTY